ncbi:MAG: acetyl-CoA carboxylase biotin carboxyl carrier protein [Desulfobacterales bacterium]
MGSLTQEEVLRILQIMDESKMAALQLEMDGLKLILERGETCRTAKISTESLESQTNNVKLVQPQVQPLVQSQQLAMSPIAIEERTEDAEELVPILSQMLGTFYKAPKPGAPPFVEVGQTISEEDTICIIEVMKLFTTIKAGINGRIAKVCVQDGELVEFNQVLFLVEPGDDEPSVTEMQDR